MMSYINPANYSSAIHLNTVLVVIFLSLGSAISNLLPSDELPTEHLFRVATDSIPDTNNELYIILPPHRSPTFGKSVFSDDFTNHQRNWTVAVKEGFRLEIESGKLVIAKKPQADSGTCMDFVFPISAFSIENDFRIRFTANFLEGDAEKRLDFTFGFTDDDQQKNSFYSFSLNDKGHLELSFNTGVGPGKNKRRYFRRMYPERLNADGANEIVILKQSYQIQFYLNNALVQHTYLRNDIETINAIGFEQCTTGSWALDDIEIRVDTIYDGLHLLDKALDQLLATEFPGEEVRYRHLYMRTHNYMQGPIIVGGNRYFAQSGLYFSDGKPSLIVTTLERYLHQLFTVIPNNDDFDVQMIENDARFMYPTDIAQILNDDAPDEVVAWMRENTKLTFSEEWRKEEHLGFKDVIWRLDYPFSRTFIEDYAPYVRYFNGGLAWDGERFRPVTYNIPLYIEFTWDMKFNSAVSFLTSVTELTDLLGEPSELGEGPYCGTMFSTGEEMRWPGIAAEISGELLFIYDLNFQLNPNIWISLGDGIQISGETTLSEFVKILPELGVSGFSDGIIPENFDISEGYFTDGYGWTFLFTNGKLSQMNNGGPC